MYLVISDEMNVSRDLFKLIYSLSQLQSREEVLKQYLEGLHDIFAPAKFFFRAERGISMGEYFELSTPYHQFGFIEADLSGEHKESYSLLIAYSVQLLAVLIDHLEYRINIKNERDDFKKLANAKIEELAGIVKDLEDTRTASINLIEDLSQEIDKRKQAEESIRKAEKYYRSLIEKAPDGIVLVNAIGKITYASPSARRIFGYSQDETELPDPNTETHPEDLPAVLAAIEAVSMDSSRFVTLEYRFRKKDGSLKWVESTFSNQFAEKGIEALVINFRDVSERKNALEQLKKTQMILKSTMDSPRDMIILAIDKDFNYLSFNNYHKDVMKAAYGSDIEIGMNLLECMSGNIDIALAKKNYVRAMKGESHTTIQEFGEKERSYYETFYNPIRDERNEIVGATAYARNITERKKAENALRDSEAKFRHIWENTPLGKSMTGIDGSLQMNKAFCDMLGYSEDVLLNKKWQEITHPDDIKESTQIVNSLMQGITKSARYEKRYIHKNGNVIWAEVRTTLMRDQNNNPTFFITSVNDISWRKKLESERFRLLDIIDRSLNEIYIFDSETLVFEYANRGALINIGYTPEELYTMTPLDIKPKFTNKSFRKAIQPLIAGKKELFVFETVHRRKNGTEYPVEIHLQLYRKDEKSLFFAVISDISERKHAENLLIKSEEKFRSIVESSPTAMYFYYLDDANQLIFNGGNPSADRIIGISHKDLIGKTIEEAFPNLAGTAIPGIYKDVATGKTGRQDFEIKYDEKRFSGYYAVSVFQNSPGNITVDFIDIEDRKRAEEEVKNLNEDLENRVNLRTSQLEAANKELEAFSYSVSHDLRAPLRAIHSFTNILTEDYYKVLDDEGRRICDIIKSSSTKMGQLIDDLLSFSRIGRTEMVYSEIDLTALVKSVYNEIVAPEDRRNVDFSVEKLPPCKGDVATLKQVFINLISNAIKYSSKSDRPEIKVGSKTENGEIVYFVKDNGVGFDMHYSHKLFGVFQRLHSSKEFEGNGVGLAIVQRIIVRHNGRVWAKGEVGKGATFFFTIKM